MTSANTSYQRLLLKSYYIWNPQCLFSVCFHLLFSCIWRTSGSFWLFTVIFCNCLFNLPQQCWRKWPSLTCVRLRREVWINKLRLLFCKSSRTFLEMFGQGRKVRSEQHLAQCWRQHTVCHCAIEVYPAKQWRRSRVNHGRVNWTVAVVRRGTIFSFRANMDHYF